MRYRKRQLHCELGITDEENCTNGDIKVNQLLAMKYMTQTWVELDADFIFNCWKHTGLIRTSRSSNTQPWEGTNLMESEHNYLQELIDEVVPP